MKSIRFSEKHRNNNNNTDPPMLKMLVESIEFILSKLLQLERMIKQPTEHNRKRGQSMVRINEKKVTKVSLRESEKLESPPKQPSNSIRSQIEGMLRKVQDFELATMHEGRSYGNAHGHSHGYSGDGGSIDGSTSVFDISRIKQCEEHINNVECMVSQELTKVKTQTEGMQDDISELIIMYKEMIVGS